MLHVTDLSNPTICNWNIPEPKKMCASLFSKKYSHCNGNSFLNYPVQPLRPDAFYNSYFNFGLWNRMLLVKPVIVSKSLWLF